MNLGAIVRRVQKTAADNTPVILTAIGVTGLVTTAVLTGQASFKAAEVLRKEKESIAEDPPYEGYEPSTRYLVEVVWKFYIPAVGTGAATIVCIIAANRIQTRRAAALATAYSILQEGFQEYKTKVVDKIGEKKEQAIRDEVAQDRLNKKPPTEIVMVGRGENLCMDLHSGRYFMSDTNTISAAVNTINSRILKNDYASLTDFWELIGLDKTSESDELGWSSDCMLELVYSTAIAADGRPCITIDFDKVPFHGYYVAYR